MASSLPNLAPPLGAAASADPAVALAPRCASACAHCGQPLPRGEQTYCCAGCEAVARALSESGLERFYALRDGTAAPVSVTQATTTWLEPVAEELAAAQGVQKLAFDLQGLHCSGCVWLIEQLFGRHQGAGRVLVNPSVGHMEIWVEPAFPLLAFVRELASFGYLAGPAGKRASTETNDLLMRLAITVALALNSMVLSAALYLGLTDGALFEFFQQLNFALGTISVAVGGSYFISAALRAARRGIAHLDQPIALGIVAAFAGSVWAYFRGTGDAYFDTLCVFVALMLGGRYLQERVLSRNRAFLLADDGIEGLPVRRERDGRLEWTRCESLKAGDIVLIAPGDLVPVDGRVLDAPALASLQWIDGEAAARSFAARSALPAGAFNAGSSALRLEVLGDFSASPLRALLGQARDVGSLGTGRFWKHLAAWYVAVVLTVAGTALVAWWVAAGPARALSVATAILVVTCPCAFGIATPLAYELVLTRLRRAGLFVRTASFLDRAAEVRQVVFDKTGTLTTGRLGLASLAPLDPLSDGERDILYQLAARSSHPKSRAVAEVLETRGAELRNDVQVEEWPGQGLSARVSEGVYRLGSPDWALDGAMAGEADLAFSRGGQPLALLTTREQERFDAASEVLALQREGYATCILSGDTGERTRALASRLGIAGDTVLGGQKPHAKAAWLRDHDAEHSLMIGDGVNDAPAMREALCGGTPAVDRPFMPARADFYFVTPGLSPIGEALHLARRLRGVVRGNLAVAVSYNAAAVAVAAAGWMAPWLAAVSMPLSSLAVIGWTLKRLPPGGAQWKS